MIRAISSEDRHFWPWTPPCHIQFVNEIHRKSPCNTLKTVTALTYQILIHGKRRARKNARVKLVVVVKNLDNFTIQPKKCELFRNHGKPMIPKLSNYWIIYILVMLEVNAGQRYQHHGTNRSYKQLHTYLLIGNIDILYHTYHGIYPNILEWSNGIYHNFKPITWMIH